MIIIIVIMIAIMLNVAITIMIMITTIKTTMLNLMTIATTGIVDVIRVCKTSLDGLLQSTVYNDFNQLFWRGQNPVHLENSMTRLLSRRPAKYRFGISITYAERTYVHAPTQSPANKF